jgi:hypothetical protein
MLGRNCGRKCNAVPFASNWINALKHSGKHCDCEKIQREGGKQPHGNHLLERKLRQNFKGMIPTFHEMFEIVFRLSGEYCCEQIEYSWDEQLRNFPVRQHFKHLHSYHWCLVWM